MDRFEMADTLKSKAGISYEEARQALEASNWDMIQAMVNLENSGKINKAETGKKQEENMESTAQKAKGILGKVFAWIKELIRQGNQNYIVIKKNGKQTHELSITAAVLLFILLHGLLVFIAVISLLSGYSFEFVGEKDREKHQQDIKDAVSAADEVQQRHTVNSFGEDNT